MLCQSFDNRKFRRFIESLCHLLDEESVEMTKQGFHCRFTQEAALFMRAMYEESLRIFENRL